MARSGDGEGRVHADGQEQDVSLPPDIRGTSDNR